MMRGMAPRPSADFRERLVAALEAGFPLSEAATRFPVSERTIYRWLRRHRRGESLAERPRSGCPPKLAPTRYPELRAVVRAHPDATLPEHAVRLEAATGSRLSCDGLSRLLCKVLGHTIAVGLCLERGLPPLTFARLLD
jgi:transposase